MLLQVHDGTIPVLPDGRRVRQLIRQLLAEKKFRMHAHDEHFLVIRTIEDADPPPFGKPARRTPEKIVFELFGAGLFETEHLKRVLFPELFFPVTAVIGVNG